MVKKKAVKKSVKKKVTRRKTVDKPRAGGTLTESAFWSLIRSTLRNKSRFWKPITDCKNNARRPYKGPKKLQKWEYLCASCGKYYAGKEVNVDHIIPAGQLNCYEDLPAFVKTLFCEQDNLQVLCTTCHDKKSAKERSKK